MFSKTNIAKNPLVCTENKPSDVNVAGRLSCFTIGPKIRHGYRIFLIKLTLETRLNLMHVQSLLVASFSQILPNYMIITYVIIECNTEMLNGGG